MLSLQLNVKVITLFHTSLGVSKEKSFSDFAWVMFSFFMCGGDYDVLVHTVAVFLYNLDPCSIADPHTTAAV